MKVFALILLFVAAASARSTGTKAVARAELGENPWLVHLRLAITTSGFLETCAGSLIDARWVLTTGGCVANARFVWVRYGVIDVIRPSLVTETSSVWTHPSYDAATGANDIGLVSLNRDVLFPENVNIAPVALASAGADLPESATFCAFGENDGTPGDILSCISVEVSAEDNVISAQSEDGQATRFDLGAPLVKDGVQYGILVRPADGENAGVFLNPADYTDWILGDANIQLNTAEVDAGRRVNFVSA